MVFIITQYNNNYKDKQNSSCPYRGKELYLVSKRKSFIIQMLEGLQWMQKKENAMKP